MTHEQTIATASATTSTGPLAWRAIEIDQHSDEWKLSVLLMDGFITEAVHDQAIQLLQDTKAASTKRILLDAPLFASPGGAMHWLVKHGLVPDEMLDEVASKVLKTSESDEDLVAETRLISYCELDPDRFLEKIRPISIRMNRRKRLWRFGGWATGLGVVVAAAAFYLAPPTTPACKSKGASASLFNISMSSYLSSIDAIQAGPPDLSNIREIGYERTSRSRGCTVDVKIGNLKTTVGFVIRPAAEGGSGFEVAMVPAEFVQTQYGGERDSESLGATIGKERLRKAFMNSLDVLPTKDVSASPTNNRQDRFGVSHSKTLSQRVMSVSPTADCTEKSPTQLSCPLRIAYEDPLLAKLSENGVLEIDEKFTFEKKGQLGRWHVSEQFEAEFLAALSKALVAAPKSLFPESTSEGKIKDRK